MRTTRTAEDRARKRDAQAEGAGQNPAEYVTGAEGSPWVKESSDPQVDDLLKRVVESENMKCAWKQVKRNKGVCGVDGRSIKETERFIREHWPDIRKRLLEGTYTPYPVLRVEIPKPGGGTRKLGIPTVVDRLIQQAISQILTPMFDSGFSESSYGFRPGRRAHDAVRQALAHQQGGKQWVVDLDLKQFFDEVDHDVLMSRLGRRVKDKRLKRLINGYLKAGVLCAEGLRPSEKGTPQGGPLSPLLSNILLDDLDKELERRGHSFCRYADDCAIYVRTQRSGLRVMDSVTRYVEEVLKLKVNREKSTVARPWKRIFLGFTFRKMWGTMRISVPERSLQRFRNHVKELLHRGRGQNVGRFIKEILNPTLRGWLQYFSLGASKRTLASLDFWIRRCLRCLIWRQWKRPATRVRRLIGLGCSQDRAMFGCTRRGPWWCSGTPFLTQALTPQYFQQRSLFSLREGMYPCDEH